MSLYNVYTFSGFCYWQDAY